LRFESIIKKAESLFRKIERIVYKKNDAAGIDLLIPGDDYLKLRGRYYSYKNLLLKNNELLKTLSDIEEEIETKTITLPSLTSYLARIFDTSFSFIQCLNDMTANRYVLLFDVLERIKKNTMAELKEEHREQAGDFVLPIDRITVKNIKDTGGKAGNLGEIHNMLKLLTPRGFSITVSGYKEFMSFNNLNQRIESLLAPLSMNDPDGMDRASEEIEILIMKSEVPYPIEDRIFKEVEKIGYDKRFSVRSSAVGEDGRISFAGQYKSILNVRQDSIIDAYKQVVASKYGRRALFYRLAKKIRDKDMPMAVFVLEMVDARSAGVLYTLNPSSPDKYEAIISSVWGQGQYAVSGTISPDVHILDRIHEGKIINKIIPRKDVQLVSVPSGGVTEVPVPEQNRGISAISDDEIKMLYDSGCLIEKYFGTPQDIEWAIDEKGRIFILQARPLHVKRVISPAGPEALREKRVLLTEGETASRGIASGPVYIIDRFEQMSGFPKGAVLVAKSSSNEYVKIMPSASALVIETGSRTSHLATVAREFNTPMIINVKNVKETLQSGEVVTVDANAGRIYKGRVISQTYVMPETAVSEDYMRAESTVKNVMKNITPLNLTTINEADIGPDDFQTVHDIVRFVHEISVKEMFRIGELTEGGGSTQMLASDLVPMYFYIIDLDGGVVDEAKFLRKISPEHICSIPFMALWRGMTYEGVRWSGPVDIDMGGLASVMARSFVRTGVTEKGGKVYVIITDQYVNLSVKLAYHFSIIDAFCGESYINNYINFRFQGGGAGIDGRNRRALFIKEVMEASGFKVEVKGDLVIADLKGASRAETEEKLDILGRLIGCSRQLDMAISSMDAKDWYVKAFLEGNYSFVHE
jgi:pyruvate,water dikinase